MSRAHIALVAFLLLSSIALPCSALEEPDYRLTVIKPGYGVNFDKVDHVIAGTTFYTHSWALSWPRVTYKPMLRFSCNLARNWKGVCLAINRYITETNFYAYETILHTQRLLDEGKAIVPPISNSSLFWEGKEASVFYVKKQADDRSRIKRQTRRNITTELPRWLKNNDQEDILDSVLPTRKIGQLYADVFDVPGPRAKKQLKQHLRNMGSATYENIKGIEQFNNDISSFSQLTHQETENLMAALNRSNHMLEKTRQNIQYFYNVIGIEENRLKQRLIHSNYIDSVMVSKVIPYISDTYRILLHQETIVKEWLRGLNTLMTGYISPFLIAERNVEDLLEHVTKVVLQKPNIFRLAASITRS